MGGFWGYDDDDALTIQRRGFLGLAMGGSAALLTACADDAPGTVETDGGTGTDTDASGTSGSPSSGPGTSQGPSGTGESTSMGGSDSSGSADESGDTGDPPAECDEPEAIEFDPEPIVYDQAIFPLAIMAGEMKPESVMFAIYIEDKQPKVLRVWTPGDRDGMVRLWHEQMVEPNADGYAKVTVEGLCAGTWYRYGFFESNFAARSLLGEVRTAIAEDVLEPLTVAVSSCNGSSFNWPALRVGADEYYDMFLHLGDMAYCDGDFTRAEYRESWKDYLSTEDMQLAYTRSGLYACWDDHEIDDNSNFDRETMDPQQLEKRQNAMDAFFEVLPIDAEGPAYQLWRTFRWGLTAEIIVLDCRYERRPSQGLYMSPEQLAWLMERLQNSPCHFKVIMNSVPITNMPGGWDFAASDRWEGYPTQRDALLKFIDDNQIDNVWFLSGDFHVCFVSRLESSGESLSSRVREIAVTGGNENPVPDLAAPLNMPQFAYGVKQARSLIITFDPESNAVHVRFIDPDTGIDAYSASLVYGEV